MSTDSEILFTRMVYRRLFLIVPSQILLEVIKHGGDGLAGDGLLPAIAVLLAMSTVCAEQAPYPTLPFL